MPGTGKPARVVQEVVEPVPQLEVDREALALLTPAAAVAVAESIFTEMVVQVEVALSSSSGSSLFVDVAFWWTSLPSKEKTPLRKSAAGFELSEKVITCLQVA